MPVSIKTALKRLVREKYCLSEGYLGYVAYTQNYLQGVEDIATNFFMNYFMTAFHNGYMINSLNIYTGPDTDHSPIEVVREEEYFTKYFSQKKLVTLYDDSLYLEERTKLFDDFDLLNKYKVIPLNKIELIDIAAVTMASMAIYSIKGHLFFYFPKFDLIIATHDNIGFILVDVSKGKQKSHYFGLNFLKQAGKIEHFKYYINEPYQEEASTID